MTNYRATIKCPRLASVGIVKGISPDDEKTMSLSEIKAQRAINEKFNARAEELGNIIISKLTDVDITWCNDGCFVISCSNGIAEMEKILTDEGLEIQPDRSDIKHKVKQITETESEEDIDVIFEPKTIGETKLLKEIMKTNQFKAKTIQ